MSLEKPTYRERLYMVKGKLDTALNMAMNLKGALEYVVDEMDARRTPRAVKSRAWQDRYEEYVQSIDNLGRIVGHIAEADTTEVKL